MKEALSVEDTLKLALEAIEFVHDTGDTQTFDMCYAKPALAAIKKALAQTQEPVAGEWIVLSESVGKLKELGWNDNAIHKANTPQRTWLGLTDAEIKDILDCGRGGLVDIKKTESKLKEKNNG